MRVVPLGRAALLEENAEKFTASHLSGPARKRVVFACSYFMESLKRRAVFEFHGELRRFLQASRRNESRLESLFWGRPALKDLIEAWGVPHTEIGEIRLGGRRVGIEESWHDLGLSGDSLIRVFPFDRQRPRPTQMPRFILDANLGGLKGFLRAVGIDSVWGTPKLL